MYYSRNIASFNLFRCESSNHRRLVSVPVPRIKDVSSLCYRFQSERITETAKRSNVVNYLDSILSRPGLLKPNRDIWRPEDNVRDFWTEYPKLGLSRKNGDGWSAWELANCCSLVFFFVFFLCFCYVFSLFCHRT